jgi:hypothetical protein
LPAEHCETKSEKGFSRFEKYFMLGLGLICLTDYVSAIWEIRLARDVFPTPWTVRIAGIPLAEVFLLGCAFALFAKAILISRLPFRWLPLDWYVGIGLVVALYGSVVGALTFTANDLLQEFLYDVRLPVDYIVTYALVSRIPKSLYQVRALWRLLLIYGLVFFATNVTGWLIWVYGFGYTPLGALGLGALVLTDVGNVFFLAYLALMGMLVLITGVATPRVQGIAGALGAAASFLLLVSSRRGQIVAIAVASTIALVFLATRRTFKRLSVLVPIAALALTAVVSSGIVDLAKYVEGVLTLLDATTASTAMRYIGDENARLNLERHDLWLTGLGMGRRYEYFVVFPEGENLTAFSEKELGQEWRHMLHAANPFLATWLRYGVIVGTFTVVLVWLMPLYAWYQSRKFRSADRLYRVLVVATLVAFFSPYVAVIGAADPKNAIISGFVFGLCSATMRYARPLTARRGT